MSTIVSAPVSLPWDRLIDIDASYPQVMADAARIRDDIAVVAYAEQITNSEFTYGHNDPTIAAVRYTTDGPEVGPATVLTSPEPGVAQRYTLEGMVAEPAINAVWILMYVQGYSGGPSYTRVGRITVNPETLALTVLWPFTIPRADAYGQLEFDIWLEQRMLLVAIQNSPTTNGMNVRSIYLFSLATGAIVAHQALPVATGAQGVMPRSVSVHSTRQEVMIVGNRINLGRDKPAVWTAPLTSTTIGTFTLAGYPLSSTSEDIDVEEIESIPRSGGRWQIVGDYWGLGQWRHVRNFLFTPPSTFEQKAAFLSTRSNSWRYNFAKTTDVFYDVDLDQVVVTVGELTDRSGGETEGEGLGGVRHVALEAGDSATVVEDFVIPGTERAIEDSLTVSLVGLGQGRFIYLVGGSAITKPYVSQRASFEFLVYAGGPDQTPPPEAGAQGEEVESRRVFRRVN